MQRNVASRHRVAAVALAPPRPASLFLCAATVAVFVFIATAVPISSRGEQGYKPFLGFGLLLAGALFFMTAMATSRVTGVGSSVRIYNLFTQRIVPASCVTGVTFDNGLVVWVGGEAFGCLGYGSSLLQQMLKSRRYRIAGQAIIAWVAAAVEEGAAEGGPRTAARRWAILGLPVCVAIGLAYTNLLWLLT